MRLHLWESSSAAGSSMSLIPMEDLAWDEMSSLLTCAFVNYATSTSLSSKAQLYRLALYDFVLLEKEVSPLAFSKFAWQPICLNRDRNEEFNLAN